MTALLTAPPPPRRVAAAILPWLVPAAALVAGLHWTNTPDGDIARYAAYFTLAVVLPGTLVFRALVGSRGNLPEDLGLGAATGLVLQLLGWALAAATGLQTLLPGWPLLILLTFLAVPRLRRHWRTADPRPLPLSWSWLLAGGLVIVVLMGLRFWATTPLPPTTTAYYQDLLYHLALVHEMTRSMPFQVPQLAGDTLRYHYLSDADMAAASMITGIAPPTVLMRLWIAPIIGVTMLAVAALARDLTGKWWAGALAGVTAIVGLPLALGGPAVGFGGNPIVTASPSQTYAYPLLTLLVVLTVQVLRGRPLRWGWLLVLPVALACAGSKSSVLPPYVAGLLLAVAVVAWRDRAKLRPLLALLALSLTAMLAGLKLFAGGGAGTLGVQPLAALYWMLPYRQTIGADDLIDGSRFLPLGVAEASTTGAAFIAGLLGWWFLFQAPRLLGLAALGLRGSRHDPAVWLLAGMTVAATGAAWLCWHPSASQIYFYLGIIPFATLLTVWLLADRAEDPRPVWAGLAAGALWAVLAPTVTAPKPPTPRGWAWTLTQPMLLTAVLAAVVAILGLLTWRLLTHRPATARSAAASSATGLTATGHLSVGSSVAGSPTADSRAVGSLATGSLTPGSAAADPLSAGFAPAGSLSAGSLTTGPSTAGPLSAGSSAVSTPAVGPSAASRPTAGLGDAGRTDVGGPNVGGPNVGRRDAGRFGVGGLVGGPGRFAVGRAGWRAISVGALAAVLGAGLGGGVDQQVRAAWQTTTEPPAWADPARRISAAEMDAAFWLDRHAADNDVVATNVHCMMISWKAVCDARAFWVAGLGGHRTLIESWGYADQTVPKDGVNGKRYYLQPPPDPDLYALNQRVFTAGDPADVARLREEHHVRWLFADSRVPGGVAARLATVATVRYAAGPVTIYQLR
ncbi:hypothetical protein ACWKSP_20025, partial [Micromonosporaceae bacterium Da 78-11]